MGRCSDWQPRQTPRADGVSILASMGAGAASSTLEAELTYGLTQNIKLAVSGPVVFQPDPYPRSSVTTNTPISGDFSGLAWWRFQKKDFAGKRIESTAVAGVLVPGPQAETGLYRGLNSGPGYLVGGVTGIASRSQYVWVGPAINATPNRKATAAPTCFPTPPFTAIARSHGAPIIRAGTGAFSGSLPASEPARFSGRTSRCPAARRSRCFSGPACWACIAPSGLKPGCSFRFIAMSGRSFQGALPLRRQLCLLFLKGTDTMRKNFRFSLCALLSRPFRDAPNCCKSTCPSSAWIE